MAETEALQRMIDELRHMRESCEPKRNSNMRYLKYSTAVSALMWIIEDLRKEERATT